LQDDIAGMVRRLQQLGRDILDQSPQLTGGDFHAPTPIGVDDQRQIVASTVTESNEQDPSQVPQLLDQIDEEIGRFIGDGIFDQEPVYAAVEAHSPGVRVVIPPRKDAVLSPTASTAPTQRDHHLLEIERTGRFAWKRRSGYYDQADAENAFARYKRTFGDRLRAKREESQERKASLACQLLNRMLEFGASALPSQLKEESLGAVRGLLDSCNNATIILTPPGSILYIHRLNGSK